MMNRIHPTRRFGFEWNPAIQIRLELLGDPRTLHLELLRHQVRLQMYHEHLQEEHHIREVLGFGRV